MIDIENEVFNRVANALRSNFTGITVYGERVESPSSFPSVTIVEDDNYRPDGTVSFTKEQPMSANLTYTVEIYSNLRTGKKAQAKDIREVIDAEMCDMAFEQTYSNPTPNVDRTIYRYTVRYTRLIQFY